MPLPRLTDHPFSLYSIKHSYESALFALALASHSPPNAISVTSLGATSNYDSSSFNPDSRRNILFYRQRANPGRPLASVINPSIPPPPARLSLFSILTPSIPPSCLPQFYFSAPSPTTRRTNLRVAAASTSTCPNETQEKELLELEEGDLAVSFRSTTSLLRLLSKSVIRPLCLISTPIGQMLKVYQSSYRSANAPT